MFHIGVYNGMRLSLYISFNNGSYRTTDAGPASGFEIFLNLLVHMGSFIIKGKTNSPPLGILEKVKCHYTVLF